ncbi:MAG TPA: amidohydrolase family protein, partial [Acidimicrobiales bacterium]|nr:amidohydrolase family protein [Acidimicrobiales bacterium]
MTSTFLPHGDVARIRGRIDHPIIDGDGHLLEVLPVVFDFVREDAGADVHGRLVRFNQARFTTGEGFLPVRVFHGLPAEHTLDRMTVTLPELLYRRLDEIGIDFSLLYPSFGLTLLSFPDDEVRQAGARALNRYFAESFAGLRDRLEPVAVIPTFTPDEAMAELDHAVGTLGLKAVVMSGVIPRAVRPDGTPAAWVDSLGHESQYDYDPVWARCVELGVVPAFHGIGYGWGSRVSSRNYVHNHLGNFAAAQEAACRALLMGGVTSRFPSLRLAFLEGGAAWACQLYADLLGHYEKRNRAVVGRYDDSRIDHDLAMALFDEYAHGPIAARRDRVARGMGHGSAVAAEVSDIDDFEESGFRSAGDI